MTSWKHALLAIADDRHSSGQEDWLHDVMNERRELLRREAKKVHVSSAAACPSDSSASKRRKEEEENLEDTCAVPRTAWLSLVAYPTFFFVPLVLGSRSSVSGCRLTRT